MGFWLKAQGWSLVDIGREIGSSAPMVGLMVRDGRFRQGVPEARSPRAGCLTILDCEQILLGLGRGESMSAVARRLRRSPSTITREVGTNGGRGNYSAGHAHQRARRHKPAKLRRGPLLREVSRRLQEPWSPQEIAQRLALDFPDNPEMRVSHETIYQSLFVQGRGELRRELARCLRSGRTARRTRARLEGRGRVPGMVMISDRPPEAADRAVPGHWEGDLILGKGWRSAVGTLVERTSRLVQLLHLREGRSASSVEAAMRTSVATLPEELCRTITWDQGAEIANHASFTVATGVPIYFCDPHAPWQRGSNENTNGLLRQDLPKGTDLSAYSAADLLRIQHSLNSRPRKTLGYLTPLEKLAEIVATTA
jgi:IS30 family transposase